MLSSRQRLLALTMAALGVLAWWQRQGDTPQGHGERVEVRRPDYWVEEFTATTMDEFGLPHERLIAAELRHYPDDGSSELERPRLTRFEESGPPWLVRSDTAWVSSDNNWIRLSGAVFIEREAGPANRPVQIETTELMVNRQEEYAHTDRHVRITSESDWTTADSGARVWFGERVRALLYGRVRGELALFP